MKYIIIGLGNFGSTLAERLTQMGHEIIGVDQTNTRVEDMKNRISSAICMDITDRNALGILPVKEVDAVIIAIGENFGASVQAIALLRQMGATDIAARAINEIHVTVLQSLGVDHVTYPEKDAAEMLALRMEMESYVSSYKVDDVYSVIQMLVPYDFTGQTVADLNLKGRFNLDVITLKRCYKERNFLGVSHSEVRVVDTYDPEKTEIEDQDVLVLYGKYNDLARLGKMLEE